MDFGIAIFVIVIVIVIGLCMAVYGSTRTEVEVARDQAEIKKAWRDEQIYTRDGMIAHAEQSLTELVRQVKENALITQRDIDLAMRAAAHQAQQMQVTLQTYLNIRESEAQFEGQKLWEKFKAYLDVEIDKLRIQNRLELGFDAKERNRLQREKEQKLLGEEPKKAAPKKPASKTAKPKKTAAKPASKAAKKPATKATKPTAKKKPGGTHAK